jgi:high frequency lysogenization protein
MNQNHLHHITLALAGVHQAIALVREVSQTGRASEPAFSASIGSIFTLEAERVETVFGDVAGVKLGLQKLLQSLDTSQEIDPPQQRYLLSILHLQKKLSRSPRAIKLLTQRLQQTQKQVDYFTLTHPTVIANLADSYLNAIKAFKFRIMILGKERIMHAPENLDKIRALLLAAVRAAVLWRQVGGSRLQLLFSRAKLKAAAESLLLQIEQNTLTQKDFI